MLPEPFASGIVFPFRGMHDLFYLLGLFARKE